MACPSCSSELTCAPSAHHYTESGLDHVHLHGVEVYSCVCGERVVSILNVQGLHDLIGRDLIHKKALLTGREISFLRKNMGLTALALAAQLGVSNSTISRWEHEDQVIQEPTDRLLRLVYATHKGIPQQEVLADFPAIEPRQIPSPQVDLQAGSWEGA